MSGLVWPEASQRIANSAYLTRERIGDGQVILFSGEPNFRGATLGTNRLWLNAIVYGPGLGTRSKINPWFCTSNYLQPGGKGLVLTLVGVGYK